MKCSVFDAQARLERGIESTCASASFAIPRGIFFAKTRQHAFTPDTMQH